MLIDLFKNVVKSIKSMFTEDNIAAAQLAQIFGSELLKVQQSVSDSRSQPDIVKLNPKQFLVGHQNFDHHRKLEEQQYLAKINREAEMMHPLPQAAPPSPPPGPSGGPGLYVPPQIDTTSPLNVSSSSPVPHTAHQSADILVLIANFLERIAVKLESVDLKPKRKTIKRKPKSNKKVLLNENNV